MTVDSDSSDRNQSWNSSDIVAVVTVETLVKVVAEQRCKVMGTLEL